MPSSPSIILSPLFGRFTNLRFGISTRNGGISPPPLGMNLSYTVGDDRDNVRKNREIFFGWLNIPPEQVAYAGQVHGADVQLVDRAGKRDACDALITAAAEIYLAISIADCLPIFLYDDRKKCIAAVHAGWRGTKDRIVVNAVNSLSKSFGSDARDLVCVIGPGAGRCCYEVGEGVAGEFAEKYVDRTRFPNPHLDLKECNKDLLLSAGVTPTNLEISGSCTICGPELFHSYRRDGKNSGRMLGVLGMKGRSGVRRGM